MIGASVHPIRLLAEPVAVMFAQTILRSVRVPGIGCVLNIIQLVKSAQISLERRIFYSAQRVTVASVNPIQPPVIPVVM